MSHNIDHSTGKPAIAYVGAKPWHKLGHQLPAGQPIEVWLEAAQLKWRLSRLPVQYLADGQLQTMDDKFVLARSDNGDALSVVSGDYQVVQPNEILEFYRDLIKDHGYALETAGALNGGRKVWALATTGRTGLIGTQATPAGSRDELAAYLLLATSCDKSLATTAAFTSIRVVCQNTLNFAVEDIAENRRRSVKVPHQQRFDAAKIKEKLGLLDKAWSGFLEHVQRMAERKLSTQEASAFFAEILGQQDGKPLTKRAKAEHDSLQSLFRSSPGQDLSTSKGTLWGAINAVTYYADHVGRGSPGDKLDSAWFGSGCSLKDKAFEAATSLLSGKV